MISTAQTCTWPADELEWARECLLSGDTIAEIAHTAGRTTEDVQRTLSAPRLTDAQREVLSLYAAGCELTDIERERGTYNPRHPGKIAANCLSALRRKGLAIPHRLARA